MSDRPVLVRLATVLAVLLFAASCGGDDGDSEAVDAVERSATDDATTTGDTTGSDDVTTDPDDTTPPAGAEPTDETASTPGAPTTTPPPDTAGSTDGGQVGAAAPGGDNTSAAPARPTVPQSGVYTFQRTTTDDEGTRTENHDVTVERLGGDDHTGRVRVTMESEQGKLTNDTSVSGTGMLVERSIISSPLGEIDCDWEPDWHVYGTLAEGSTWTVDTACHDTAAGLEVDVAITGSGAVVGTEEIDVAGARLTAWVFETTTVTEFRVSSPSVNGTQRSESTSRTWFDPARGMQVRDESRRQNSGDFESGTSEVVSEFTSFRAG